jgi:hypothetical protein
LVSKKPVERLDGIYRLHGIGITDTTLITSVIFMEKKAFRTPSVRRTSVLLRHKTVPTG